MRPRSLVERLKHQKKVSNFISKYVKKNFNMYPITMHTVINTMDPYFLFQACDWHTTKSRMRKAWKTVKSADPLRKLLVHPCCFWSDIQHGELPQYDEAWGIFSVEVSCLKFVFYTRPVVKYKPQHRKQQSLTLCTHCRHIRWQEAIQKSAIYRLPSLLHQMSLTNLVPELPPDVSLSHHANTQCFHRM